MTERPRDKALDYAGFTRLQVVAIHREAWSGQHDDGKCYYFDGERFLWPCGYKYSIVPVWTMILGTAGTEPAMRDRIATVLSSLLYMVLRRLLGMLSSRDRAVEQIRLENLVLLPPGRDPSPSGEAPRLPDEGPRPPRRGESDPVERARVRVPRSPRDHHALASTAGGSQVDAPNPRWGYLRIKGELQGLGIRVSASAIAMLLRRSGIGPAPRRDPTWSQFLKAQASGTIACDFFTVETALLKTLRSTVEQARKRAQVCETRVCHLDGSLIRMPRGKNDKP